MFSSSLRSSPIWSELGPVFTSSPNSSKWAFHGTAVPAFCFPSLDLVVTLQTDSTTDSRFVEAQLDTADLRLPFVPSTSAFESHLTVLLLLPSSFTSRNLDSMKHRLTNFSNAGSAHKLVVLFQQDPTSSALGGVQAFMLLQTSVMDLKSPPPAIPVTNAAALLPAIESHIAALQQPPSVTVSRPLPLTQLIAHATSAAPDRLLPREKANAISNLVPSIGALEEVIRTSEGRAQLCKWTGESTAKGIIEFWEDEWIV